MFSFFRKKTDETAPAADAIPEAKPIHEEPVVASVPEASAPTTSSWTDRLKAGLAKTRDKLGKNLASLFGGGQIADDRVGLS